MQVSANKTFFFKPVGNWTASGSRYAVCYYNTNSDENWVDFVNANITGFTGVYKATIPDNFSKIKICRMNGSTTDNNWDNKWDCSNELTALDGVYYETYSDNWSNFTPKTTLLPWDYFFASDKSGSWKMIGIMTESSGTYTYTFSAADYAGKNVSWASGDAFTSAGDVTDWTKVFQPLNSAGGYHWIAFENYSYDPVYQGNADRRWHVPSLHENSTAYIPEGTITISYVKASNSATISPKKNVSISSEGWATYSNSENYKVSGATAYIITAVGSTATLTALSADAEIPGGTGIMLKGDAGSYVVTPSDGSATISNNLLMGSNNYTFNITGEYYGTNYDGYVLSGSGETLGFYPVNPSSNTLPIHKAFLKIDKVGGTSRTFDFISLSDGNTTSIANLNVNENIDTNAPMYNLAGQRVNKNYKGVVIVNGKKMLNK